MSLELVIKLVIILEVLLFAMLLSPMFYVLLLPISFPFMDAIYPSVMGLNLKLYNIITVFLVMSMIYKYSKDSVVPSITNFKTSVLFIFSISLSIFFSEYPAYSLRLVLLEALAILLFWCVGLAAETHEQLSKSIRVWLWAANIVALLEILDYGLGLAGFTRLFQIQHKYMVALGRPTGWFEEPNRASQFHMLVALWTLPLVMVSNKLPKERPLASLFTLRASFFLNSIIVLLGVGRASWLGLFLGGLVAFLAFYARDFVKIRKVAAFSIIAAIMFVVLISNYTFRNFLEQRFKQTLQEMVLAEGESNLALGVSSIANLTFTVFQGLDRPITGHGLGTFPNYFLAMGLYHTKTIPGTSYERATEYEITFNRFAQIFFGAGLLGLITYIIWQWDVCSRLMTSNSPYPYRVAFLAVVVGMLWGHDQFRAVVGYAPFYWLIGLAVAMERIYGEDNRE